MGCSRFFPLCITLATTVLTCDPEFKDVEPLIPILWLPR